MKLMCMLLGHKWKYGEKGLFENGKYRPYSRYCIRCKRHELALVYGALGGIWRRKK